jgi:YVTN family beta-propeller protein
MRFSLLLLAASLCAPGEDFRPPAGTRPAARRPGAESILPGGRMISPLGRQFQTGPGAFGLAISPDGKLAVTANGGPHRSSLTVLDMTGRNWQVRQLDAGRRSAPREGAEDGWRGVFMGLAFADGRRLFASEGHSGRVREILLPSGTPLGAYHLDQGPWRGSYSGDVAYDGRRRLLFVADPANSRVAIFDTRTRRLAASVRTGRRPFKMALAPGGRRLYVTNIGMFEHRPAPSATQENARETGPPSPAFGFPPAESNSLCVIDVSDFARPRVVGFTRTGAPSGPAGAGGGGPSGVVASAGSIYVSNAHQDSISVIDPITLAVRTAIPLRIPRLEAYRGILPLGMALDLHGGRLLVAEAGINAIGVVDLTTNRLAGHLPAAWFPAAVAVDRGRVFVASAKGHGTGPNATRAAPLAASLQGELRRGSLGVFDIPLNSHLPRFTERVMLLNGFFARKLEPAPLPRELRYAVVIVKENRTYDEIFGGLAEASNGPLSGAPELGRLGRRGWVWQEEGSLKVRVDKKFYDITPNHHSLAARYAFSDNFYADSEVGVDGHHWVVGSYPDAWTESSRMASGGGQQDFRFPATAPGRLPFEPSNPSLHPGEQLDPGALWHHLERHGIAFRNFGEGFELASADEDKGEDPSPTGARYLANVSLPGPLYRNTSRVYPRYGMNIPDQYRAAAFIDEIERLYVKPGRDLPRLLFIHLPNDRMARPRPGDGYPYAASFVADNDYALGRIVEYLSHTPWWSNMAVFVTEGDAQGGVDHVDSHRTLLLIASPWARRNHASRINTSFPGLLKTVFRLLGLPPLNLYDATAADLADCFSESDPDFTPYQALRPDPDVFVPEKAKDPQDPKPQPALDSPVFLREPHRQSARPPGP